MDKETLSNYGWIVVCVLVLATLIALAGPFGNFIAQGFKATTAGFGFANQNALNSVGIDTDDMGFDGDPASCGIEGHYIGDDKGEHGIPVEDCASGHTYTCECEDWVVPDGGKYYVGVTSTALGDYTGATKVYNAGEKLPCGYEPSYGDTYVDEDYEYRYDSYLRSNNSPKWSKNPQNGWSVRTKNTTQKEYGEILENIASKPINGMIRTFLNCNSLLIAPKIPSSVTNISYVFSGCTSLKTYVGSKDTDGDFSNYIIPNSVTDMGFAFSGCQFLTTAPAIPNSVTDIQYTFQNTSIVIAPVIPNSVTYMERTFNGCTALTTAPVIPNGITKLIGTFSGCTNLKTYVGSKNVDGDFSDYIIPNSVTDMSETFSSCKSLTTAPTIPNGVYKLRYTFSYCSSLKVAPIIPDGVEYMYGAFTGCKSLTGTIEINANPKDYGSCFGSLDFTTNNITLKGTSTMLDEIGTTGKNYCAVCNGKCLNNH